MLTVLTTASLVAMYISRTSSDYGGTSVGKDFRYYLSSMKVDVAYSSHWKPSTFHRNM
jgi:hypothetical protein